MSMFTCCTQPTSWVSQLSVKGHALPAPATKGAIGIHNISTPIYRFLIDKFLKWFYLFLLFLVVSGYSGCFVLPEGLRLFSEQDTCAAWVPHFAPTAPSKQLGDLVAHSSDRRWKKHRLDETNQGPFHHPNYCREIHMMHQHIQSQTCTVSIYVHQIGMLSDILMIIWSPLWLFSKFWHILALRFLPPSHANVCECASKCLKV